MIEAQLLDYINSGHCYALVGSGPSCEMGYPSWHALAVRTVESLKRVLGNDEPEGYPKLLRQERYPDLFERAKRDMGEAALVEEVRAALKPNDKQGEIYGYLAKWPFAGYLTTNYDDELLHHLRREKIHGTKLLNSPDDFRSITSSSRDFVLKLHGEPGSEDFILTAGDYSKCRSGDALEYYRRKVESFFAMFKICIIGYGLRDPDIEFIFEKAKQYATPSNPVFMLSTDLDRREVDDLFDKFNIRVIPYENTDGTHRQLRRILSTYDAHIVPRETIHVDIAEKDKESAELASSLFLFTQMQLAGKSTEFLEDAAKAAVLSALRKLPEGSESNRSALATTVPLASSFWQSIDDDTCQRVLSNLVSTGLAQIVESKIVLTKEGVELVDAGRQQRRLLVSQFEGQAQLDFKREFPEATEHESKQFTDALEMALVTAFRKRGLEIVNFIVHENPVRTFDATDLFRSFKKWSASLTGQAVRYFFIKYTTDLLLYPNILQKQYLWHLSQGYFAYHALRLDPGAKAFSKTLLSRNVWILDSSVIIPLLAKGCVNHKFTFDLFERIRSLGVPAVTLMGIVDEVEDHAIWARGFVRKYGEGSPEFLKVALAKGDVRQNLFVDGYIQSWADGACLSFEQYLTGIFGERPYSLAIIQMLGQFKVKVLELHEWPGFSQEDLGEIEYYATEITRRRAEAGTYRSEHQCRADAEVYYALLQEANGKYKFGSSDGGFFVSQSGILNVVRERSGATKRFAWKPEAFYRFVLCFPVVTPSEDCLQECMLSELLTTGVEVIDTKKYNEYFKPIIRQSRFTFKGVIDHYHATVRQKFPMTMEEAFEQTPDLEKPFFPLQMAEFTARSAAQELMKMRGEAKLTQEERSELNFLRKKYAKKAMKKGKKGRKNQKGKKGR